MAPDKIERLLFNLLTNALRHTPSDGSIAVRVQRRESDVLLRVEDTGEGLPEEAEARMFDRFWRANRARSGNGAASGSRSRAGSSRRTAAASGSRTGRRAARASPFTLPAA